MEGTRGSWIVETPHVPTWLHLQSDRSIGSCRLSSLVVCDLVLLVENLDGICIVCQIGCNGMVSSITTSVEDFKHLLSWET
jgi:hypothetical protein